MMPMLLIGYRTMFFILDQNMWTLSITSFTEFGGGNVTFGDGNVARVKGKGTIYAPNIPNLEKVLYVEGLEANLISISQMCENEFNV